MGKVQGTIRLHRDMYEDPKPAVCVKSYGAWPEVDGATDKQTESAYQWTVEQFWQDAEEIAQAFGYAGVYSEGRSGGWVVPYLSSVKGYPGRTVYPDPDNPKEARQFLRFQAKILRLLDYCVKTGYAENLRSIMEEDRATAYASWRAKHGTAANRYR